MCCVFVHTNIDNTRRASSPLVTLCGTGAYASGASLATVSFREEFFSETQLTLRAKKVVRHLPKPAESREALPKL